VEVHELEALIQQRFDAMPKAARAELLRVLMLPTSSEPTGSASPGLTRRSLAFAELLIDAEEDRIVRALLVGMLRER
jgi:hypothetical protein